MSWEELVQRKRQEQSNAIPPEWELTSLDLEITEIASARTLLSRIASGRYTAVQVTTAYCRRSTVAQKASNCLTEIFYDKALTRAHQLDAYYTSHGGKTIGPLHGLPVSLKDNFSVLGVATTVGIASWIAREPAQSNSVIAQSLLDAGAVLYVKTNVPPAMSTMETANNVFGRTTNPFNHTLSVGGSSGGESALIASKGSILGVGTDVGASLRVPAMFTGLYALKPSAGRLPSLGSQSPNRVGVESIVSVAGPMARSLDSIELFCKSVLAQKPWERDPKVVPIPWNVSLVISSDPRKKLTFGFIYTDNIAYPTPPVRRALDLVRKVAENDGHGVVEIDVKDLHRRGVECAHKMFLQSGGREVLEALDKSGEPHVPRLFCGNQSTELPAPEVYANHAVRNALQVEYLQMLKDSSPDDKKIDVLVCPVAAHPANPHGKWITNSYTAIYSLLDYPAMALPVTRVDPRLDQPNAEWSGRIPYSKIDTQAPEFGDAELQELYNSAETFENAPVGVQLVGRRLQEEELLSVARTVDELLQEK
jgi:amidase